MNKWWLASTAVLLLLVACATDAKKKWKADEDFEFEEVPKLIPLSIITVVITPTRSQPRLDYYPSLLLRAGTQYGTSVDIVTVNWYLI